mmetsp:Transcript_34152/g.34808  ORF Transcript_34152/g.34808 Transcript_34152/m.34808 type:complete len:315 (+) Transcript_34152:60-1004(+)|eukprot:CAMPEP_0182416296 /NCGR_PEP_ID=MMETSP1167-20130531/567_1 /TAXON_ID=2988 /ORGANISM="Mallomonas Sp, Strain CCMP3275" /LENGTH=314 /DNA_ID=CAMNT_0024588941 /DNA_START=42 /DNA_END=986 /DNA_ORIENTATION=+
MIGSSRFSLLSLLYLSYAFAATKDKPHHHSGVLKAYDGKQISYDLTPDQQKKLDSGNPIIITTEDGGKSGRGFVLQDIEAPGSICLDKISDLKNYPKMVPHVKKVEIYEEETFANGTTHYGAQFHVGLFAMRFSYFLKLTREEKYKTFTWTLDFRHSSDFDDTVGHWQVMPHPSKAGFTRVLYSTELKLPGWVPRMIVSFLTNTALVEATGWVRKESEKDFKKLSSSGGSTDSLLSAPSTLCYTEDEAGAHYDSICHVKSTMITDEPPASSSVSVSSEEGVAGSSSQDAAETDLATAGIQEIERGGDGTAAEEL